MSVTYVYKCPKCNLLYADPPSQVYRPYPEATYTCEHFFCVVCKEWVKAELVHSIFRG